MAGASQENAGAPLKPSVAASKSVTGKVTAKSETSLTVNSTKIALTTTTAFSKGGAPIRLDEINVGDEVRVTLAGESGEAQALSVEVMAGDK